jgi:LuxR family transcriptional regulator, maltose regulon positive regulatory protein
VLALDDYHRVAGPDINAQLELFVEHLPPTLQVSLTTRVEPPLPLPRWRARGELFEIDLAGLRFEPTEAEELLNRILGLGLDRGRVAKLCERTEGWAAGLYLAALSLRGAPDRESFVERFAGDDRNVVDYLGAEVLAAQPVRVREALVHSSILDRFCAPLLQAVTGTEDGASLLRDIERADLFLIPLDSKRQWYRYHHLFQQLLRLELSIAHPGAEPDLHRRAAAWFLEAGITDEGIRHTIAAGDTGEAAELIAQHWMLTLLGEHGDRTIDSWLQALGEEAIADDFRLCFARCFVDLSYGRLEEVVRWIPIAEKAPPREPGYGGPASKAGGLATVRAALDWESGNVEAADPAAREILELEDETSPWRALGPAVIGLCALARGEWAEGSKWSREYARLGAKFGQVLNDSSGSGTASVCEAELGNWEEAERLARHSYEISTTYGLNEHWMISEAHQTFGRLHARSGELDQAERELERAGEVARRGAGPVSTGNALLHLALVRIARGDRDGARDALEEAERRVSEAPDAGPLLPRRLADARRKLTPSVSPRAAAGEELSDRELDVLRLLATSMTQREIGNELYVSLNTVKTHTKNIFRKLDAANREQAVARARELGLL